MEMETEERRRRRGDGGGVRLSSAETETEKEATGNTSGQGNLDIVCREVYICKFCGVFAKQPVLNVICGHLFCWPCLYRDFKRRARNGHPQCCPLCESHLDISPTSSTIIRVCSGPQPGFVASGMDDEYETRAEEGERSLKVKGVPPRPRYQDTSRFSSTRSYMACLFGLLDSFRAEVCQYCEALCEENVGDPEFYTELIQEEIDDMIKEIKDVRVWLKGEENSEFPSATIEKNNVTRKKGICVTRKKRVVKVVKFSANRLSSRVFFGQMPDKHRRLKQHKLLHQPDMSSDCLQSFSCTICSKLAYEPVVIKSGHLFCWTCLHREDKYPFICCPTTKFSARTDLVDTSVSSVYCTGSKYEEEDALLVAHRHIKFHVNQETDDYRTRLPSRPHPAVSVQFIVHMLSSVKEEGDVIMELLDGIISNWNDDREKVEKICKEVRGRMDALFAWLLGLWCAKCEQQQNGYQVEAKYGIRTFINDIIKDEYYDMAWNRLMSGPGLVYG